MLSKAQELKNEIIRLRRDIHQHPELSFEEERTAKLVAETLDEIGIKTVKTQVGRTGVIADIGTGSGPTIGIRADMDALPITEKTDVPWKSQTEGIMHACGHDAHTAILLGVAHMLQQDFVDNGSKWNGTVRLLFQPSEEKFDEQGISGATAMISDEALQGVDNTIALHVSSDRESGKLYFADGMALAAVDAFEATIYGDGGHGASPHTGSDPLFILSNVLPHIYGIPGRRVAPLESCIVSLGSIHAGKAMNVIPGEVYINGTIRTFSDEVRATVHEELERSFKFAEVMGGSYKLSINKGYPAMYNTASVNDVMRGVTGEFAGAEAIVNGTFGMGAEDFSYMTAAAPGAMFMLGADNGGGAHHTSLFDIDEDVFPMGAAVLAETARRYVTGEAQM